MTPTLWISLVVVSVGALCAIAAIVHDQKRRLEERQLFEYLRNQCDPEYLERVAEGMRRFGRVTRYPQHQEPR